MVHLQAVWQSLWKRLLVFRGLVLTTQSQVGAVPLPAPQRFISCAPNPEVCSAPSRAQPAQAVRWSHWLLGHAAAWQRDDMRLCDLLPRVATLPLGSGRAHLPVAPAPRPSVPRSFRAWPQPGGITPVYLYPCPRPQPKGISRRQQSVCQLISTDKASMSDHC